MPDAPSTSAGTVAVRSEVQRDEFVETFTMREGDFRTQVAVNAIANKALMQLNVAKLRSLIDRTLSFYDKNPAAIPSPKELKILSEAVDTVEDLGARAYSDSKAAKGLGNSLERLVYAATAGAASGAAVADNIRSNSPTARLKRLNSIGKPKAEEPKPAPAETVVELD